MPVGEAVALKWFLPMLGLVLRASHEVAPCQMKEMRSDNPVIVVAIGGPSGSGKSLLAQKLNELSRQCVATTLERQIVCVFVWCVVCCMCKCVCVCVQKPTSSNSWIAWYDVRVCVHKYGPP